ncbi:hypothetical protein EHQ19_08295 [Leptospira montravelensis]|uniref:hypothetical protein n=1 Tax=Leptospira montravelensis TaxID=2484961 RepID=UPI00108377E6|nr:hypothetical protein [Leptospira montravelensis]TGK82996.1 hypothetical protein EHQ19_08295 [Leptospira montravelensis]
MNITYLLGAGASANQIPIVKDFISEISKFKSQLSERFKLNEEFFDNANQQTTITVFDAKKKLLEDYDWLISEARNFSTIDTFAKKLYITGDKENYLKLKFLISYFLSAIQSTSKNDYRYDNLFAALIGIKNRKATLPENLSIISWNYDLQTEISISKFLNKKIEVNLLESLQNSSALQNINEAKFNLIKLNGTAGFYQENQNRIFDFDINNFANSDINTKKELSKYLTRTNQENETLLSFSWDNEAYIDSARKTASNVLMKSEFLVIIGYSFPVFNRDIDRELLSKFNQNGKIFIQDKTNSKNIAEVVSEMSNISDKRLKIIESVEEFFIPLFYTPKY